MGTGDIWSPWPLRYELLDLLDAYGVTITLETIPLHILAGEFHTAL